MSDPRFDSIHDRLDELNASIPKPRSVDYTFDEYVVRGSTPVPTSDRDLAACSTIAQQIFQHRQATPDGQKQQVLVLVGGAWSLLGSLRYRGDGVLEFSTLDDANIRSVHLVNLQLLHIRMTHVSNAEVVDKGQIGF